MNNKRHDRLSGPLDPRLGMHMLEAFQYIYIYIYKYMGFCDKLRIKSIKRFQRSDEQRAVDIKQSRGDDVGVSMRHGFDGFT
jgi:hypothetical protein